MSYCEGDAASHLAAHERGAAEGACPFFACGWAALVDHPPLAAHVAPPPYCFRDVTPTHTPALRRARCARVSSRPR